MDKYELLETIGEGTYGIVFKCRHTRTNRIVAVKRFKEAHGNEYIRCTMLRELRVQQLLKGEPYVVQLLEAFQEKGTLFLVMENVPRNLLDVLDRQPDGLSVDSLRVLIFTLLLGLRSCHSNGIVHRDVKPENILIKDDGAATLCDFGFSRPITLTQSSRSASPALHRWSTRHPAEPEVAAASESDDSDGPRRAPRTPAGTHTLPTLDELVLAQHQDCMTDYVATRWYRSPEMLLGMQQYDFAVDVWAVGAIMAEAADGQPLLPGNTELEQLSLIQTRVGPFPKQYQSLVRKRCGGVLPAQLKNPKNKNPLRPVSSASSSRPYTNYLRDRFLDRVGEDGVDLLEQLLSPSASRRVSVEEALTHTFFASLAGRHFQSAAGSPISRETSAFTAGQPSSDTLDDQEQEDEGDEPEEVARLAATATSAATTTSARAVSLSPSTSSASFLTPVRTPSQLPPDESPNPRIAQDAVTTPAAVLPARSKKLASSVGAASLARQHSDDSGQRQRRRLPERKTTSPVRTVDTAVRLVESGVEEASIGTGRATKKQGRRPDARAEDRMPALEALDTAAASLRELPQPFNTSTNSASGPTARFTRHSHETSHDGAQKPRRHPEPREPYTLARYASASRVHQKGVDPVRSNAWAQRRELPTNESSRRETTPDKRKSQHSRPPPAATTATSSLADGPPLVPRDTNSSHNGGAKPTSKAHAGAKAAQSGKRAVNSSALTSRSAYGSARATRPGASTSRHGSPDFRRTVMKAKRPSHEEKPRLLREIETLTCAVAPVESLEELLPIPSPTTSARRASTRTAVPGAAAALAAAPATSESHPPSSGSERVAKSPPPSDELTEAPVRRRAGHRPEADERANRVLPPSVGRHGQRTSHLASPTDGALDEVSGGHQRYNSHTNLRRSSDSLHNSSVASLSLPAVPPLASPPHAAGGASEGGASGAGGGVGITSAMASSANATHFTVPQDTKARSMVFRARRHSPLGPLRLPGGAAGELSFLASSQLSASGLPDADVGTGAEGGPTSMYAPGQFGRRPQPKLRRPPPLAQAPTLSPMALASTVNTVDEDDEDGPPALPPLPASNNTSPSLSSDTGLHRQRAELLDDLLMVQRSRTDTPSAEPSPLHFTRDGVDHAASQLVEPSTAARLRGMPPPPLGRNGDAFHRVSPMPSYGSSSCISPVAGVTMDSVVRFQQQQLSSTRKKTRLALKPSTTSGTAESKTPL